MEVVGVRKIIKTIISLHPFSKPVSEDGLVINTSHFAIAKIFNHPSTINQMLLNTFID